VGLNLDGRYSLVKGSEMKFRSSRRLTVIRVSLGAPDVITRKFISKPVKKTAIDSEIG
jgi:hypothetical protein